MWSISCHVKTKKQFATDSLYEQLSILPWKNTDQNISGASDFVLSILTKEHVLECVSCRIDKFYVTPKASDLFKNQNQHTVENSEAVSHCDLAQTS